MGKSTAICGPVQEGNRHFYQARFNGHYREFVPPFSRTYFETKEVEETA
jgi:hypothetical protein